MGVSSVIVYGVPIDVLWTVLSFTWGLFIWENYLNWRQQKVAKRSTVVPPSLQTLMEAESFTKARMYSVDKINFEMISGVYGILQLSAFLFFGLFGWLWYTCQAHVVQFNGFLESINISIGLTKNNEIICSLLFVVYVSFFSFLDSMPWSLYRNFVIEARYGFNQQTIGFFFKDKLKSLALNIAIGLPITAGLLWIIKLGGDFFCIYAYCFCLCVSLLMMFIYPEFIAPLFDRYEPLPEGPLRSKIEALASEISFPLKKLFVVEGSKRSSHSNAYFYGFGGNKRIVLFDTLIKGFKMPSKVEENRKDEEKVVELKTEDDASTSRGCEDDEEILAVLAHELGHWKLNHITKHLITSQVNLLLMFIVFGYLINFDILFTCFGFYPNTTPILLRLIIIFQFVFMPYNALIAFIITFVTRKFEFQADAFAVGLKSGEKLKSALLVLTKDNLSFPVFDWMYSLFNLSHPPLLERFAAIDNAVKSKSD